MKTNKYVFMVIVALLLACAVIPAVAQDVDKIQYPKLNKLEIPNVTKITLDNGMRLYLAPDKELPVFRIATRINCGSFLEPADKIGLTSICAATLRTGGTLKWSGDEIDEMLEAVGASVETFIGLASGGASVNVLSEYTELGIEVLADILRNPQFEEDKIELAKVQERSAITRRNDDPQGIAFREYRKIIYGPESVYARNSEHKTINAVTRDDLIAFHSKYYKPQNVQLAIWGDFDEKELLALLDKYFGTWEMEGDPVPQLPEVEYSFDQNVYSISRPEVNQTNIVLGHIGGLVSDDDYAARIVMNNIFGGGFGSRMFNAVRSKEGLAYATFGVYTANITHPGVFYGFASTKSETTAKAIKEIVNQIELMQTVPPTADEMRMGKDGYLNSFVFKFDTKSEVVNRMMNHDFYGLPEDLLFKRKEAVEAVTPEDVTAAAVRNLKPGSLRILAVGDDANYETPLAELGLGPVTDIDVTIPSGEEETDLVVTDESLTKGKEYLDKAIAAAGGLDAFKTVKSFAIKGAVIVITPQGEMAIQIDALQVFPDQSRTIISVMGQTMYDIRNGSEGWKMVGPGQYGPKSEDEMVQEDKDIARNTIRIYQSADDPYYQTVYEGGGFANDVAVEFVTLLDKEGDPICKLAFNAESWELVSKSYWGQSMAGEGAIEETYSNLTTIAGISVALNRAQTLNGQPASRTELTEFQVNVEIPANAFDKPE